MKRIEIFDIIYMDNVGWLSCGLHRFDIMARMMRDF